MSILTPVIDHLDLSTKLIYLLPGITEYHPVEDIYVEVRSIRRTDESMRVFDIPVTAEGAVPKGGGKYTPRYAIFSHGWKVRPNDVDHTLSVTGEQITDDGQSGPACIDTTNLASSIIIQYEPPAAEIIRDEDSLRAIAHMEFNGGITYDEINGFAGTGLNYLNIQIGTPRAPSNNPIHAHAIGIEQGFSVGFIIGDVTFVDGVDMSGFTFIGSGKDRSTIAIPDSATAYNCTYMDAHVTGVLDGDSKLEDCLIDNLSYIKGYIESCVLSEGRIQLDGGGIAHFLDCYSGVPGTGTAILDMGGSGQGLAMRNYNGGILLTNKTGVDKVSIDLNSGQVKLDMTGEFGDAGITNGIIVVRGIGKVIEATTGEYLSTGYYGGLYLLNETMNQENISSSVWEYSAALQLMADVAFMKDIEGGRWHVVDNQMVFYNEDNVTEIARFSLLDSEGQPTETTVAQRVRV